MKTTPSKFNPFQLVTKEPNEDNQEKVIIVAGNTQVSPLEFDSEEEAEKYLAEQPYEMFSNLYAIFRYYEKKENKKRKAENKKRV